MRIYLPVSARRILGGLGIMLALLTPGCGAKQDTASSTAPATGAQTTGASGQSAAASPAGASDADMRKSFSQKSFDINNVPPEQRERVRAMMQQNATSGPSAPGATQK